MRCRADILPMTTYSASVCKLQHFEKIKSVVNTYIRVDIYVNKP